MQTTTTPPKADQPHTAPSTSSKAKKAARDSGASGADQMIELERRSAHFDDRLQKLAEEQKDLLARKRAILNQIDALKEKRLNDFMRASDLVNFSPEVWKAAQAEIQAALAKVASRV